MSNIKTNKKIILITLGILLVLSLLVGASYAYYIVTHSQTNSNVVKSTCISLSLTNEQNDISLDKQYPISDEDGTSLTPYSFTLTNTCRNAISYNLNLEMLEGTTLNSKYVKTKLNSRGAVNLATLDTTDTSINTSTEARILTTGVLLSEESINYEFRMWMDGSTEADNNSMNKEFLAKIVVTGVPTKVYNFDYTGTEQVFTVPQTGTYKIETWGAQGGGWYNSSASIDGGVGGYSNGFIFLNKNDILYVRVGKSSENYHKESHAPAGGGATSIKNSLLDDGSLTNYKNDIDKIIIVSGGGGGSEWASGQGGSGGGFIGGSGLRSSAINAEGGTQLSGGNGSTIKDPETRYSGGGTQNAIGHSYDESKAAGFGFGGSAINNATPVKLVVAGGGGGGYYGGAAGGDWGAGGAGGSSFISGHNGCDAIKEESIENNIIHTGQSIHYSGLYFTDTVMIDGEGYKWTTEKGSYTGMPTHDGTGKMKGNAGNGFARITYIGNDK